MFANSHFRKLPAHCSSKIRLNGPLPSEAGIF